MLFQNPSFLYALPAMLIPVIVHLFSFRRYRKVYFSNVKMLQAIQIETRRQSKLRHWMVLAARMLAIGALVLAFSRPYMAKDSKTPVTGKNTIVGLYIDNSFSMANEGARGMLFEQARMKAIEMVAAWPTTTHFKVLTNDFSYRGQQILTKEQARQYITTIELSPASRTLSQVMIRQKESNQDANRNLNFLFSDFQKSFCDIGSIVSDTMCRTTLIPLPATTAANIVIDTCRFESPALQTERTLKLIVSISNHSDHDVENLPVRLIINNQQKSTIKLSIAANTTTETTLPFMLTEAGFHQAVIETDDQPITYDNRYYMAFNLTGIVDVLHITAGAPDRWIKTLFDADSTIRLQQSPVREIDYSIIADQNLIIIDGPDLIAEALSTAIVDFVKQGGSLWISPSSKGENTDLNRLLSRLGADQLQTPDTVSTRIEHINQQADLYREVVESIPQNANLPVIRKHFRIGSNIRQQSQPLLSLQNGDALLNHYQLEQGSIYLFTSPLNLDGGNFVRHDLMVPTLYSAAYLSVKPGKLSYTVMKETTIKLPGVASEGQLKISKPDGSDERIPTIRSSARSTDVFTGTDIITDGFYKLATDETTHRILAFNYARSESTPTYFTAGELQDALLLAGKDNIAVALNPELPATAIIAETTENQNIWKLFIVVTLIFLALEVILLRLPESLFKPTKRAEPTNSIPE